jgi:hypothetical protein
MPSHTHTQRERERGRGRERERGREGERVCERRDDEATHLRQASEVKECSADIHGRVIPRDLLESHQKFITQSFSPMENGEWKMTECEKGQERKRGGEEGGWRVLPDLAHHM